MTGDHPLIATQGRGRAHPVVHAGYIHGVRPVCPARLLGGHRCQPGVVYVLRHPERDLFKIGRTRKSPAARVFDIRRRYNVQLEIIAAWTVHCDAGLEAYWHARFESRWFAGEWFRLSAGDLLAMNQLTSFDGGLVKPGAGIEPATARLRIGCSTTELPRRSCHKNTTKATVNNAATRNLLRGRNLQKRAVASEPTTASFGRVAFQALFPSPHHLTPLNPVATDPEPGPNSRFDLPQNDHTNRSDVGAQRTTVGDGLLRRSGSCTDQQRDTSDGDLS